MSVLAWWIVGIAVLVVLAGIGIGVFLHWVEKAEARASQGEDRGDR